ncbi:MAG: hypothetical protein LBE34_09200 [Flavobacteriaceae bacterium]|jgi:hypothetical protein|nr:hypothetical protein [Flavobacteriaceae bacterium]
MKRKLLLFVFILLGNFIYAQMGIGIDVPTEMLDVNGTIRMRGVNYLKDENIKQLYFNEKGVLGPHKVDTPAQIYAGVGNDKFAPATAVNDFNTGKRVVVPIKLNDAIVNNLGFTESGDYLKIAKDGFYSYNVSLNLLSKLVNPSDPIQVYALLHYSSDNGATWKKLSIILFRIGKITSSTGSDYVGEVNNLIIPNAIVEHKANDLVRLSFIRAVASGSNPPVYLGSEVTRFELTNELGLKGYNLIVNKL